LRHTPHPQVADPFRRALQFKGRRLLAAPDPLQPHLNMLLAAERFDFGHRAHLAAIGILAHRLQVPRQRQSQGVGGASVHAENLVTGAQQLGA